MTDYADLDQVNRLYAENENVNAAIDLIDNGGGWVSAFSVAPAPPVAAREGDPIMTPAVPYMTIGLSIPPPGDPALTPAVRTALVNRSAAIMAELAALGVTDTPPTGTRREVPLPIMPAPVPMPPMPTPASTGAPGGASEPSGATGTTGTANGATAASSGSTGATSDAPA